MKYIKKAYINGSFVEKEEKLEVVSPLDNKVVGTVPALKKEDIDFAFASARASFKDWKNTSLEIREALLSKYLDILETRADDIAQTMHDEIAKDFEESKVEVVRSIEYGRKTIKTWREINFKTQTASGRISNQYRTPHGVVLAISPFNYPVNLALAKILPALLVGNTVVFKAATNGSLVGAALAEIFAEVGIPKGVFNYVTGRGRDIGDYLTASKEISMITFTGGIDVGKNIAKNSSMIPLILELGGNDCAYVRPDADLNNTTKEIIDGSFGFSGQRCTAIKRVLLHKDVAEKLIPLLLDRVKNLKMVPLITPSAAKYVVELLEDAKANGAKVLYGGNHEGNLVEQTIIMTTPKTRAWVEEAFGPLLPIAIVDNDQDAIEIMNDTSYGLQNSIFTSDIEWAENASLQIESGTVNINYKSSRGPDEFPFLGIKNSGFGTQGISEALLSMTRILNVVKKQ